MHIFIDRSEENNIFELAKTYGLYCYLCGEYILKMKNSPRFRIIHEYDEIRLNIVNEMICKSINLYVLCSNFYHDRPVDAA